MAVSNVRGRLPTKRIDKYKDHEFVVGRIVLGGDETMEAVAVLGGAGTWAAPVECAEADHHWFNFVLNGKAASGSSRAIAIDLEQKTTGTASPCCLKVEAKAGNGIAVQGMGALDGKICFGTAGAKVTGECAAVTGQLNVPNRAMDAGGGHYAGKFEIYLSGTSADISPTQKHAILKLQVFGGNAAAQRKVLNLFELIGPEGAKASKYIISNADVGDGGAGGIQINVNGTQRWIPYWAIA